MDVDVGGSYGEENMARVLARRPLSPVSQAISPAVPHCRGGSTVGGPHAHSSDSTARGHGAR